MNQCEICGGELTSNFFLVAFERTGDIFACCPDCAAYWRKLTDRVQQNPINGITLRCVGDQGDQGDGKEKI